MQTFEEGHVYRRNPAFLPAVKKLLRSRGVQAGVDEWIFTPTGKHRRNPLFNPPAVLQALEEVANKGIAEFIDVTP